MAIRSLIHAVALLFIANAAVARQGEDAIPGPWSGVIINSTCGPNEAFAEAPKCTEKGVPGAKLALFDDTIRQVYIFNPQEQAIGHEGEYVTATGRLEGNSLHLSSLTMVNSFGLAIGQKAPAFSSRDQFGHVQNLDTLKGSKGTVLLFFRPADW